MTKLNFSKTRIVYWNSNRSTITLPANTSILPANVEILKTDDIVSIPYLVCKVVGNSGTNEGHQWHNIPYNSYGLYCPPCEINTLFENCNSFTPLSCAVTIDHNIPLTKTATTSTTQLSFNNTIYSLIADLPGNDHVCLTRDWTTVKETDIFCRTFDGSRYDNMQRNVLPQPDILFKVPRIFNEGTFNSILRFADSARYEGAQVNNQFWEEGTGFYQGYTQNGLVNAYPTA